MTSRAEHLAWAKARALEYVEAGELPVAIASFVSDMQKHPDTAALLFSPSQHGEGFAALSPKLSDGLEASMMRNAAGVRRWIESFE